MQPAHSMVANNAAITVYDVRGLEFCVIKRGVLQ